LRIVVGNAYRGIRGWFVTAADRAIHHVAQVDTRRIAQPFVAGTAIDITLADRLLCFNLCGVVCFARAQALGIAGGGEFDFANYVQNQAVAVDGRIDITEATTSPIPLSVLRAAAVVVVPPVVVVVVVAQGPLSSGLRAPPRLSAAQPNTP
jgi:hypothetical protein